MYFEITNNFLSSACPIQVPLDIPLNFAASPNQKLLNEEFDTMESVNSVPSFQTLQQIYNIPSNIPGISVVQ